MGIYIYSVRTKHIKLVIDGKSQPVHALQYLTKVTHSTHGSAVSLISRAEKAWERRGESPKYVVLCGTKILDGNPVWEWDGRATDYDTPNFAGIKQELGWVHKSGYVWTLETNKWEAVIGKKEENILHIRLDRECWSQEEIDDWIDANFDSTRDNTWKITNRTITNGRETQKVQYYTGQTFVDKSGLV